MIRSFASADRRSLRGKGLLQCHLYSGTFRDLYLGQMSANIVEYFTLCCGFVVYWLRLNPVPHGEPVAAVVIQIDQRADIDIKIA